MYHDADRRMVRSEPISRAAVGRDARPNASSHDDHPPCVKLTSTAGDFCQQPVTWKILPPSSAVNSG